MKAKILLVEGKRAESPSFLIGLTRKGFQVESVPNGSAALARLAEDLPHLVIVNASSMRTSGKRICLSLRDKINALPIVLIVDAAAGSMNKVDANLVLTLPFTLQKLVNRIRPLLPALDQKDLLLAGPLQLDVEQRLVRCESRQARLTPRLVTLLKVLMENPGQLIERKELFKQVWDTAYTVDTRTLDVHVSWLRQAVEDDPRHPRYIKTIRGVGYRLDVEPPTRPLPLRPIREKPDKPPRSEEQPPLD
jgi:DNA-binding response OmpR family regulator